MTVKRRRVLGFSYNERASQASPWNVGLYRDWWDQTNILISQGHGDWPSKFDGGGPMAMVQTKFAISPSAVNTPVYKGLHVTQTAVNWGAGSGDYSLPTLASSATLNARGATAIARSLPTSPAVDASVAIGELRNEGLPKYIGSSVFKENVSIAKKAGDEYLNYEFGWRPLVSTLIDFCHAVKHSEEIWAGYVKGSGKQIRRRYLFPTAEGMMHLPTSNVAQVGRAYVNNNISYPLDVRGVDRFERKQWFSGSFKYYVPLGDDMSSKLQRHASYANKILGLRLTPEVVWNLSPWSWAADWFANTGDIMKNISSLGRDGLVLRYGYMMNQSITSREINAVNAPSNPVPYSSMFKQTNIVRQRLAANPYGFGVTFDSLSSKQKAIITALGLSKLG